jgi:hypothetical protein
VRDQTRKIKSGKQQAEPAKSKAQMFVSRSTTSIALIVAKSWNNKHKVCQFIGTNCKPMLLEGCFKMWLVVHNKRFCQMWLYITKGFAMHHTTWTDQSDCPIKLNCNFFPDPF